MQLQQQLKVQSDARVAAEEELLKLRTSSAKETQQLRSSFEDSLDKGIKHHQEVLRSSEGLWKEEVAGLRLALKQEQGLRQQQGAQHVADKVAWEAALTGSHKLVTDHEQQFER